MQNVDLALTSFLVLTCAATADAQFIVAHRGASYDAPENTLAAFRLAWEQQADAVEGDFYVTKDQQIVCIHDNTTKRVSPQHPELSITESTLEELQKLDVGSWKHPQYATERIPTLKEVLATVPEGKRIFVEIKCGPEILPLLQPQFESSGLKPDQIVIICFDESVVTQARRLMPQYNANWLTGYKQETKESKWKPSREDVLSTLQRTKATGLGTNGNLEVIDQAFANSIRAAGFQLHVWTVNEMTAAQKFVTLGVHSITTDRPEFIRKSLQSQAAD